MHFINSVSLFLNASLLKRWQIRGALLCARLYARFSFESKALAATMR